MNADECNMHYGFRCISWPRGVTIFRNIPGKLKKRLAALGRPHLVGPFFEWHQSRGVQTYDLN